MMNQLKAVGLISGGLDSILAVKIIQEQNIDVIGLCFTSPFFDNSTNVSKIAETLKIKFKIIALADDYIKMIQQPKYGYGKAFNPCIDCHIYMLKQAKKVMTESKADFIFTGEVLGERPMSQNKQALINIERETGLKGLLLRPLSAQLLEPTIPEKNCLVNRDKLGKISGRSRKPQLGLARKYGITDFPQPAGGCLLTEASFSKKVKDAFEHNEYSLSDLELLKIGRHFRIDNSTKIIVGRNEQENKQLLNLKKPADLIIEPIETTGPIVVVRGNKNDINAIQIGSGLCAQYSDKNNKRLVKVKYNDIIIETESLDESIINQIRI